MKLKYVFNGISTTLLQMTTPSVQAPPAKEAPMQNSPAQAITTFPLERETIDMSAMAMEWPQQSDMHYRAIVQQIPVRQPGWLLLAPHAGIGQKTEGIADQRLGQLSYPVDRARSSYVIGAMHAPARLQSVPGYTVTQTQTTRTSQGYPKTASKAPRPRTGGGGCN